MQTTWRSVALAVAVALLLAAVTLFVIFRFLLPGSTPTPVDQPRYVIGSWEGQVAVFEGQAAYPMQVFDVYVSTLPEEERTKVQTGIPVADETQLYQLLEDYTS
jgi:hypothetical protein